MGTSVHGLSEYELTQPLQKTMCHVVSQKGAHVPCLRPSSSPIGVYRRQTWACHTTFLAALFHKSQNLERVLMCPGRRKDSELWCSHIMQPYTVVKMNRIQLDIVA